MKIVFPSSVHNLSQKEYNSIENLLYIYIFTTF